MASNVVNHPLQQESDDEECVADSEKASLLETSGPVETDPEGSGRSSDWRRG